MRYSKSKEIHKFVQNLIRQGWKFWRGSKHGRLRHPCGRGTVTVPCSPSDKRSFQNFKRDVRRVVEDFGKTPKQHANLHRAS